MRALQVLFPTERHALCCHHLIQRKPKPSHCLRRWLCSILAAAHVKCKQSQKAHHRLHTPSKRDAAVAFLHGMHNFHRLDSCLLCTVQGKLRIGLGEESVVSALAHAQLLHAEGGTDADSGLANRLERAVQAVKQAVSQCPSYDVLIPALLQFPLEVRPEAQHHESRDVGSPYIVMFGQGLPSALATL